MMNTTTFGSGDDTEEDISNYRNTESHQQVSTKKKQGPFEKLGLELHLTKAIIRLGYKLPTPIQRKAIPPILAGRDVVAMARTGSGKTAAFGFPAVQRLGKHSFTVGIRCVILEPSRELAFQVAKVMRQICKYTDLKICVLVGGAAMQMQFEKLANNPDIVVATPGRLVHHITESDLALSAVEHFVMDEADRLFEMGMAEQLSQILKGVNVNRQCVLTSATLPSQLYEFAKAELKSPEFIRLDADESISKNLDMWFLYTRTDEKLPCLLFLLRELLNATSSDLEPIKIPTVSSPIAQGTMVFVASRHHVEFLGTLLKKAQIPASLAYGSMDQQARIESLANFKKGKTKVFVVTDVAARGLDIPAVGTVINFDFPMSPKHFVHRVGRTARAGRSGLAISLITYSELAYAVELLLFAGYKFDIFEDASKGSITNPSLTYNASEVDQSSSNEDKVTVTRGLTQLDSSSTTSFRPLYLGTTPNLSGDVEFLRQCLEDVEVSSLFRSMMNSYIPYNKMRRPASKQSVRRAKDLVTRSGGTSRLLSLIHPGLVEIAKKNGLSVLSAEREQFLEEFRKVKPKTASKGIKGSRQSSVLSPRVVQKMETKQLMSDLKNFNTLVDKSTTECDDNNLMDVEKNNGWESESNVSDNDNDKEFHTSETDMSTVDDTSKMKDVVDGEQVATPLVTKPRLSAAARRTLKKRKLNGSSLISTSPANISRSLRLAKKCYKIVDVFDWKSMAVNRSNFFLSTERTFQDEVKDMRESCLTIAGTKHAGLQAMADAQFNLVPDNDIEQRKAKQVKKWNAIRKRYVMTAVDSDGKVLGVKQQKKRNEAGVIIRGELQKKGIYKNWTHSSKRRIQRVGETELPYNNYLSSTKKQETMVDDFRDEPLPELSTLTKDKGLVEALEKGEQLTHKQKRKAKRLLKLQKGEVVVGQEGGEIRNARQLTKTKKDALERKAKQNRKLREELHKKGKDKHMRKRALQHEKTGLSRRSFVIPSRSKVRNSRK